MTPHLDLDRVRQPDLRQKPRVRAEAIIKGLLTNDDTFGTTLLLLCLDRWPPGEDEHGNKHQGCLEWTPETLRAEIEIEFGVRLSDVLMAKLAHIIVVVTTDRFFQDAACFVRVCNALAGEDTDNEFDPADSAECALGIMEAVLLWPPDDDDPEPFSEDVRRYIGHVLKLEGYINTPDVLKFAVGTKPVGQVAAEWTDEPDMFTAIHAVQQDKTDEINQLIRESLASLGEQLKVLPLQHGDTSEIVQRIEALAQHTANQEDPL